MKSMKTIFLILTIFSCILVKSQTNTYTNKTIDLNFKMDNYNDNDFDNFKMDNGLNKSIKINSNTLGNSYSSKGISDGLIMTIGGGAMLLTSILTIPSYYWGGVKQNAPYSKSTPRFLAMGFGIITLSAGIVLTIGG